MLFSQTTYHSSRADLGKDRGVEPNFGKSFQEETETKFCPLKLDWLFFPKTIFSGIGYFSFYIMSNNKTKWNSKRKIYLLKHFINCQYASNSEILCTYFLSASQHLRHFVWHLK